jgi:hypothetical protein
MMKKMDNPTVRFPTNRPHSPYISNLAELRATRRVMRKRVKDDETLLKDRLQELPGQLLYTGVKYVIPSVLQGGVTNTVLDAGKGLVDLFFVKKNGQEQGGKRRIPPSLKKAGLLTALKWGIRLALKAI